MFQYNKCMVEKWVKVRKPWIYKFAGFCQQFHDVCNAVTVTRENMGDERCHQQFR